MAHSIYHPRFKPIILVVLLCVVMPINVIADEDDLDDENSIATATVILDESIQLSSGLKTITLTKSNYQPEIIAYGKGVSLLPLLELRSQYFAKTAELTFTETSYQQAKQELARQKTLFSAKAITHKKLQGQKSKLQSLHASMLAQQFQLKQIRASALLNWGQKLAIMAFNPKSKQLDQWLENSATLLRINLPKNYELPQDMEHIHVYKSAQRNRAVTAELIAPAPHTLEQQLISYFFLSNSPLIQPSMRISAWLPTSQQPYSGIIIPGSAIIRYLNHSFVYIQTDKNIFKRQTIDDLVKIDQDYFIPQSLKAGNTLVVNGVQMLWSEEFRGRIPDEDDD